MGVCVGMCGSGILNDMAHNALVPEVRKKTSGRKTLWVMERWEVSAETKGH